MDSRNLIKDRRISYQWRLFIPMALTLWITIIGMAWFQVSRVEETRKQMALDQLKSIAGRIVEAYETNIDPEPFMDFMNRFYARAHDYDELSIVIRDTSTNKVISQRGPVILFHPSQLEGRKGVMYINSSADGTPMDCLYYSAFTPQQEEVVYVFLPYTKKLAETISQKARNMWFIFIVVGLVATILTYISALYVGRNIRLLGDFARAASDPSSEGLNLDSESFPHDELGDISRQIVTIYSQRMAEMSRREREHRVALHAIEEKSRIKRDLTSNINHELKTPIGIIKGYVDTIIDTPDMDSETRDRFMHKTQENVNRLIALISDITAITKLDNGEKLINVTDVNFHDLVFTLSNDFEESNLFEGKMTLSFDVPLNCEVFANEALLTGIISNLTRNAMLYSQGTLCALEYIDEDDDFYRFRFYDNGIGVPPEHLPHLFDRFYRVNAGRSRNAGGTGLGLAIVKVTIESFSGTIEVDNRQPSGLQFTFTLPKYKKTK